MNTTLKIHSYDADIINSLNNQAGVVNSVYDKAVSFDISGKLITVTGLSRGRGPGFILTEDPEPDFASLKIVHDMPVCIYEDFISIGKNITLSKDSSQTFSSLLCYPQISADRQMITENYNYLINYLKDNSDHNPESAASILFGENKESKSSLYISEIIDNFLRSAEGEGGCIKDSAVKLIGLGYGLTPSCDDFLLGIMSVWQALRNSLKGADIISPQFLFLVEILSSIISKNIFRTGFISGSYLLYAIENRFTQAVSEFVFELLSSDIKKKRRIFDHFRKYGASSGFDILSGIAAGVYLSGLPEVNFGFTGSGLL